MRRESEEAGEGDQSESAQLLHRLVMMYYFGNQVGQGQDDDNLKKIYFGAREKKRECFPIFWFIPQLGLGQSKVRSQELAAELPPGWQGSKYMYH